MPNIDTALDKRKKEREFRRDLENRLLSVEPKVKEMLSTKEICLSEYDCSKPEAERLAYTHAVLSIYQKMGIYTNLDGLENKLRMNGVRYSLV